jgi:biotin operon repressor
MFDWLFNRKKEVVQVKQDTKKAFEGVREDIKSISKWLEHLKESDSKTNSRFEEIDSRLSTIEEDLSAIKNFVAVAGAGRLSKQPFKQQTPVYSKQTVVQGVQTPVQTPVQTGESSDFLIRNLSVMERALVYVLMNSDMRLSYDDLSAMLGKSRATIRGQINAIKQKSEGLLEENVEKNGKKRVYIPEEVKEILLKDAKVRVKKKRNTPERDV